MKYLGLWSPRVQMIFEKFVKTSGPTPPTYLIMLPYYKEIWKS